jgi:hypothetical protein
MSLPAYTYAVEDFERDWPGNNNGPCLDLKADCHPEAGFIVAYDRSSKCILVACGWCKETVAMVRVAKTRAEDPDAFVDEDDVPQEPPY